MFDHNIKVNRGRYNDVQYYLIRINKMRYDGTFQYPFVLAPNGIGPATQSALEFANEHNYPVVINAGVFDTDPDSMTLKPYGIVVENSVIINNVPERHRRQPMCIDKNGDLFSVPVDADATKLKDVVSAVCGFGPIVIDYVGVNEKSYAHPVGWMSDSQRMIIGQFGNGDYAIICSEGRGFDNSSPGWTIPDAIDFCMSINLKFAYNLDGGGSSGLVVGKKQLNAIYEGENGRAVPTFIIFNGTTKFQ